MRDDLRAVVEAVAPLPVKAILEVHHLTPDETKRACELAIAAGAAFVKTSTGWAPTGASLEVVRLITSFVGEAIKVKAAGSVRDLETVLAMLELGVARFGINLGASLEILRDCGDRPGGGVELERAPAATAPPPPLPGARRSTPVV